MKSLKEYILESNSFEISLTDKEYQILRKASMRGKFNHKFERNGSSVKIRTQRPKALVKDLESLIDSGASSWYEILGVE